jgi:hypothetical protein
MNWEVGVAIVMIGLVGIGTLVSRLEHSASLNRNEELSPATENNCTTPHSPRQALEAATRGRAYAAAQVNRVTSPIASNRSLQLKIAIGRFRIELVSKRTAVGDRYRRNSIKRNPRGRSRGK